MNFPSLWDLPTFHCWVTRLREGNANHAFVSPQHSLQKVRPEVRIQIDPNFLTALEVPEYVYMPTSSAEGQLA